MRNGVVDSSVDIRARSLRLYYLLPSLLAEGNRGKSNSNGTGLPNWTSVKRRSWTSWEAFEIDHMIIFVRSCHHTTRWSHDHDNMM